MTLTRTEKLTPFQSPAPAIQVSARVEQRAGTLDIEFTLTGNLTEIVLPETSLMPIRKDGLWQHTCLEVFAGFQGSPAYWEFNFAPSGNWNAYSFDDYRGGMRPTPGISELKLNQKREPNAYTLSAQLPRAIFAAASGAVKTGAPALEISFTAVIESRGGSKSFWALTHTGKQPDFHRRDSFLVRIPEKG